MPDVEDLNAEDRKRLLGCVQAKNRKWKEDNDKSELPQAVIQKHFRECSQSLGFED